MNPILSATGILAASIAAAGAAHYTDDSVGTFNGNAKPILEATGNSLTSATFATSISSAFANNTGGVWDFDGTSFGVDVGETITLNYGTSLANSLVLTLSSGNSINQGNTSGEPTSGTNLLGFNDASTRVFTPSKALLTVGIFNTNRGDAGRIPVLTVTYQDNSTASTSGANAGAVYFHGLSGTQSNPIKSFSISQNNFVRYDDLGFIVASEGAVIDSDNDDLADSWELLYFEDLTTTDGDLTGIPDDDFDDDGMTDKEEHDNGTNPIIPDTDNDGLTDGEEFNGTWNPFDEAPTNPLAADSDGDGVNDTNEVFGSLNPFNSEPTNPNVPDTDGDGMSDGYELANNMPDTALDPNDGGSTDPTQAPGADRDGDGLTNLQESDPASGPNSSSPQTRADLADTDNDGLSDLVEDNTNVWNGLTATGSDPTDPDSDDDGISDNLENLDLESYPGAGVFPTNSNPNLADTDGDGYNDNFEANNGFDPNDSLSTPVRTTVGVINPDAGTNGLTVVDSPANAGDAKFLTLSSMASLMTTEFAANNGGVINWDAANGWTGTATEFSTAYGAGHSGMLTITMAPPVDGGAPTTFGQGSGGGSTATSSSTTYLAFSGGSGAGTPVTFNFSKGLSAWGITQLARPGDRTVTMSFTLADASVISYAPDTVTDSSTTLNWYGVQAPASNPIMSVTLTSNGFVRYDDMAFVVSSPAGYATWADANAPGQTMNQDHDGDGVDNGIEYFMGLSGPAFTSNPSPVAGAVTWPMGAAYTGVYGTDYEVQSSTDLVTWTQVPIGSGDNTVGVTAGTSVVYDVATGGKRFVRLVVKN